MPAATAAAVIPENVSVVSLAPPPPSLLLLLLLLAARLFRLPLLLLFLSNPLFMFMVIHMNISH